MAMGISATYLSGAFLSWSILAYVCSIVPSTGFLVMFFMPESPIWLRSKDLETEAVKSEIWLKKPTEQRWVKFGKLIFKVKVKFLRTAEMTQQKSADLWSRKCLLPFGISMMLMFFQQWTGVNSVIFYTVNIFMAAKISMSEHLATNIIGLVQLLATAGNLF